MDAANDNELPRSRAEAREAGSTHYFTGVPCKYGHLDIRYTRDGTCAECSRIKSLQRYYADWEANKAKTRDYMNLRYASDPVFRTAAKAKQKQPKVIEWKREYGRKRRAAMTEDDRLKTREYMRDYQLNRHQSSPKARLNRSISGGMYKSIAAGSKAGRKWEALVGYTISDLIAHLEKQFLPGMSWENYGEWHIDHKIPKSAFNYETPDDIDFRRCWAISNLRPMWAKENISKGKKLEKPFQPSLLLATNDNRPPQKETKLG